MCSQNPNFGFQISSVPTRIDKMLFPENPNFGFENLWNPGLIAKPLFAASQTPAPGSAPGSAPLVQQAPGSAWERWEDRGHGRPPRPVVPEPGAYGAAMLAAVLAVVVARRLASRGTPGPR